MFIIKNILIADDELNQREVLKSFLEKSFPSVNIQLCSNGLEALNIIKSKAIDVLITDIKMPLFDGIELIKEIKASKFKIHVVLISAYREFSYAKIAIECDVVDYITKPFRIKNIVDLINNINERMCEELKRNNKLKQYEELQSQYQLNQRNKKLNLLLEGSCDKRDLDSLLLEQLNTKGRLILVRWKLKNDKREKGFISKTQQENLVINIKSSFPTSLFVPIDRTNKSDEKILAMLTTNIKDEECFNIFSNLLNLEAQIGVVFWVGISKTHFPLIDNIKNVKEEALKMLSFYFYYPYESKIFYYDMYYKNLTLNIPNLENCERKLYLALQKNKKTEIENIIDEQYNIFLNSPKAEPQKIIDSIRLLVQRLNKELYSIMNQDDYYYFINNNKCKFAKCDSLENLFAIAKDILSINCSYLESKKANYDFLENLILYIKNHLDEDVSLQTMANKVHLSANYLSYKVKEKTGFNYTNYINNLRIEKAISLLLNSDKKVLDISKSCGFNDSCYFNRVFRKKYSLSPEQYRKFHKNVK
ncbi:MAG: response regulator transcription factor [Pleomorphochaeta sp.]